MLISEAMNRAGINNNGKPMQEAWFFVTCRDCGTRQNLSEVETRASGQATEYVCMNGCRSPLMVVGSAPVEGGYRIGDVGFNPVGQFEIRILAGE